MNDINNVQAAAAVAAGASLVGGGLAGLKYAYGRPRRAAQQAATRQARALRRGDAADQSRSAPSYKVRPAARVVQQANRTAAAVSPAQRGARLDVGTLEELLAGLFSLRNDLDTLSRELAEIRDRKAA
jgi:hypothetical protein